MSLRQKIENILKEKGPMAHNELAKHLAAPVPSVRRSLQQLVKAGTVRCGGRRDDPRPSVKLWLIPSVTELEAAAEPPVPETAV